jgi:hypothetical protein
VLIEEQEIVMSLYFRLLWVWIRAAGRRRIQMGETIELEMRVWPQDLDINGWRCARAGVLCWEAALSLIVGR